MNEQTVIQVNDMDGTRDVPATVIGQIALHQALALDGLDASRLVMTHVRSGYWFWEFDGATPLEALVHLAHLLALFDFDTYMAGDYCDKSFVAGVKAVIRRWETGEAVTA